MGNLVKKRLFPSEKAFRFYAALADLLETKSEQDNGILIAEVAAKCAISYGAAYYWSKIFESFGFITKTRERRHTALLHMRQQIIIRWNDKKNIDELERLIDCDGWLLKYKIQCNPPLPKEWPIPRN